MIDYSNDYGDRVWFKKPENYDECRAEGHKPCPKQDGASACTCKCGTRIYFRRLPDQFKEVGALPRARHDDGNEPIKS